MWHGEFRHPRLVEFHDAVCLWSRDDFFLSLVGEPPARVLDLGAARAGTLALAAAGHRVTGVDPAHASLQAARAKLGAERVTWVEGTSRSLPRTRSTWC